MTETNQRSTLIQGLPDLQFNANQEEYNAWHLACLNALDETKGFLFVDVNDGVMNYLTLHILVSRHPEMRPKAEEHCPEIVKRAMDDLGMGMGSMHIAQKLGADPDETELIMFRDVFDLQGATS